MRQNETKSILITGCSSGIGYESALYLHKAGYMVFATAREESDVQRLQSEGLNAHQLDVSNQKSIQKALKWVLDQNSGKLFALFNNAGFGQPGAIEDLPSKALREQFETNVFGLVAMTQAVLPIMRAQGHGRIIQHSSVLGIVSLKFRGAYNASKYAVEGICDTLRLELTDTDIHVSLLNTGPVESDFRKNAIKNFKKYIDLNSSTFKKQYQSEILSEQNSNQASAFTLKPDAVIEKIVLALESKNPAPRYYITRATYILGFLKRILSTRALDKVLIRV